MLNAVQIVVTLLIMMSVGYAMSAKKLISEEVATFLSRLVLWIGVPASAFDNMFGYFNMDMLRGAGVGIVAPFFSILISFLAGYGIVLLLKIERGRRGIFCNMFALSNTIFIGLPVSQALFGEASTPYALFYYMSNTFLFWTVGTYLVQRDSDAVSGAPRAKIFSWNTVKKVFSPGLVSFVLALVAVMMGVKLPLFAMKTFKYLSGICTPLALIFIGHVIQRIGLRNLRLRKDTWGVLLGRVILTPLLVLASTSFVGAPVNMSQVFVVQASMPVMSNAPIIARAYGSDSRFASECMAITTLLSVILLPLLMLLFQYIF
jgi:predicted permease